MKNIYKNILVTGLCLAGFSAFAQIKDTVSYTGKFLGLLVPPCTDSIIVDITGAQGGGGNDGSSIGGNGGLGGHVMATLPVTPGDSIFVYIGGHGDSAITPGAPGHGGWNGGDSGATISGSYAGGGGGGGSDIRLNGRLLTDRIVVAGGGGGGGFDCSFAAEIGGSGGGLKGDSGSHCDPEYGEGGTQIAGGAGAIYSGYGTGGDGSLGMGGMGGAPSAGGGGGGGYYGGGGGSWGGGGGGSGYTEPTAVSVTQTNGYQNGNGYAVITFKGGFNPGITSQTNVLCNGASTGSATASPATGKYTYAWAPSGGTSATASNLTAGTYTVTIKDSAGCSATASAVITQPTAITIIIDSAIHGGCKDSLWGIVTGGITPYSYMWSPVGATTDSIGNLCGGNFTLTVTDKNGCKDSAKINVIVTGIDEISSNNGVKVYPVPATGVLNIDVLDQSFGFSALTVFDMTGRQVMEEKTTISSTHITLDVSKLDNGVYFLRMTGSGNTQKDIRFEITR